MGMTKKRVAAVLVVLLIITALAACSGSSDKEAGEISNAKAKAAYSEVLAQYRGAAAMPWEEYTQRKADFPLVSERAIRNYPGGGYLLCAYYDINHDGLDELLIASNYDIPDRDMPLTAVDVFVYNNGNVYSVMADKLGPDEEKQILYTPEIHKNGIIAIDVRTGYYEAINVDGILSPCWHKKETWFYKLDENEESLETVDYLLSEDGKYYHGEDEIDVAEYLGIRREEHFDYYDTYDIPYEPLIEDSQEQEK